MGLSDLREFLTPAFELPINGAKYAVSPTAELVLRIRDYYQNPDNTTLGRDDAQTLALSLGAEVFGADYDPDAKVITGRDGSVWAQMEADGVSGDQQLRAMQTAMLWFGMSHELAEAFWETGGIPLPNFSAPEPTPEPVKPNRATRRAGSRKKAGSKAAEAGTTPAQEP